jgi:predicted class III extradiol MEMO1 family dioxygenase
VIEVLERKDLNFAAKFVKYAQSSRAESLRDSSVSYAAGFFYLL